MNSKTKLMNDMQKVQGLSIRKTTLPCNLPQQVPILCLIPPLTSGPGTYGTDLP